MKVIEFFALVLPPVLIMALAHFSVAALAGRRNAAWFTIGAVGGMLAVYGGLWLTFLC